MIPPYRAVKKANKKDGLAKRAKDAAAKKKGTASPKKGGAGKLGPGWFTQPLSGKAYKQERNAAEREEFSPLARQLEREVIASRRQQGAVGDYFADYERKLAALRGETAGSYAAAQGQLADRTNQAAGLDASRMAAIQAEAQADAAKRGVDTDPSVAARGASAQAARNHLQTTFGGLLAGQGANTVGYLADKERIGAREGIAQRLKEAARERSILSDERELAARRKEFRRDFRNRARETERQFHLETQALGSKDRYSKAIQNVARLGQHKTVDVNNTYKGAGKGESDKFGVTNKKVAQAKLKSSGKTFANWRKAADWLIAKHNINPGTARAVAKALYQSGA